jgi:hypothetical protein
MVCMCMFFQAWHQMKKAARTMDGSASIPAVLTGATSATQLGFRCVGVQRLFCVGHPGRNDNITFDAFTAALCKDTDTSHLQVVNCIACYTRLPPNLLANSTSDVFHHVMTVLPSADDCRRSRRPAAQVFTSHSRHALRQAATVAASATEGPLQLVLYTKEGCPLCDGLQVRLVSQLPAVTEPSTISLS